MTPASSKPARRNRYVRASRTGPLALTPVKRTLLRFVADYGLLSLPQLVTLTGLSPKSTRQHMRVLYDAALVDVVAVSRAALLDPTEAPDPSLAFGTAPNIYLPTTKGLRTLEAMGGAGEEPPRRHYGVRNSLFLAHELQIRDFRIFLELSARAQPDQRLERWRDGGNAEIALGGTSPRVFRPDAWFVYPVGPSVLVGLLEVDRGTERGRLRWREKVGSYAALYRGGFLRHATGYANARILVVAPDDRRRDALCALVADEAGPDLAARFWFASRSALTTPDLAAAVWRRPSESPLRALISNNPLTSERGERHE